MIEQVIVILAALWTVISGVVALTPTKADDELVSRLRRFVERLSFLQPSNSPGVLSLPGAPAKPPTDVDEEP